ESQRYDDTITSTTTAVTAPGSVTVKPAKMPANLFVGAALIIDEGHANQERVTVSAFDVTLGTFTATFAKTHAAGFAISEPVHFDALPDMAIDRSGTTTDGTIYVTWTRFYPPTQFPGKPTLSSGTEIMLAVSTDHGKTWHLRLKDVGGVTLSAVSDPLVLGGARTQATEGTGFSTISRV